MFFVNRVWWGGAARMTIIARIPSSQNHQAPRVSRRKNSVSCLVECGEIFLKFLAATLHGY